MLDFINAPINPDTPRLFNVISTFAGCGGSSLGYKWAGGKVLAAVEWDDNAVATYKLNHHGASVLHRDIATVTAEELLELTGLKQCELDIFDGSPPCQGFSTAGKRQIDDPRNSLFKEYVRLLRGLQPKVFVMENVSGMVKGHMKHVFAIAMRELKASGYQVKCQLMNAMYFGVPQSRERVIFIGVRNDLGIEPSHPVAQSEPIGCVRLDEHPAVYSERRYGDTLETPGQPIGTVTKIGRKFWTKTLEFGHLSYSVNTSFPRSFQFVGTLNDRKARVGNTVPPLFMAAIAEHIYTHILAQLPERECV